MSNEKEETPLVTPRRVFAEAGIDPTEYGCTAAIMVFMPIGPLAKLFSGEPLGKGRVFSMVNKCWMCHDNGGILLLGPLYGGPVCASSIEELAVLGVKRIVGFGLSGSLMPDIAPGDLMLAESGFTSDGTSKEYTARDESQPDPDMFALAQRIFRERSLDFMTGKVWTTDAIYREFPSKVAEWRSRGASFVNMETSPFYAVAYETGIRAVYLSLISDHVGGEEWTGWAGDLSQGINQLWAACGDILQRAHENDL